MGRLIIPQVARRCSAPSGNQSMQSAPITSALLFLALLVPAYGEEVGPKVGDAAPELRVSEWIKGEPISRFERGQVYVVEFWATWCIPCVYSMPHLSDIQQKYRDQGVTVIAVSVMEEMEEDSFDVPGNGILPKEVFSGRAIAERYVRKIDTHVAIDANTTGEQAGVMAKAWLGEDRAIPRCLIVDRDMKIAWIGHPMRVDGPLAAVVAGTYDAEKQRTIDNEFARLDSELGKALLAKEWKQAMQVLDQLKAVDPTSAPQNVSNHIKCLIGLGEYRAAHEFAESSAGETRDRFVQGLIAYELFQAPADRRDLDLVIKIATEAAQDAHFFSMQVLWKVLEVKGDKPALIALLNRLLEFDPRNTVVAKRLEELTAKGAEGTDPSPASNPPRVPDGPPQ